MYAPTHFRGLGGSTPPTFGQQLSAGAASGAITGIMTGITSGPIAGAIASGLAVVAPFTGPAAPFLLAAAALVGPIAKQFGCGQTCVSATKFADQAQAAAQKLQQMYWAQPVRYYSAQQQAVAYLNQLADWLRASCGDPSLGNAGARCISERLIRGAPAPWCPNAGHVGCDFYTSILDPIANDAGVVPDPVASNAGPGFSIGGNTTNQPASLAAGFNFQSLLTPLLLLGGAYLISEAV